MAIARRATAIGIGQVARSIWPFYGAIVVALLLTTYLPEVSLTLPRWLLGYQP